MNFPDESNPMQEERLVAAARWRINLAERGVETSLAFAAWLEDPQNQAAWAQVSMPWKFLGEQFGTPELAAARQSALDAASKAHAASGPPGVWRHALTGVAAALIISLAAAWGGAAWLHRPDEYSTAQGERRIITLADGSRVSLDSNSGVTVRYMDNARMLHLLHGQARFDVAHDVERPFSVVAGGQKVIATGTSFNIDLGGPGVLVTLIEGHVVVVDERTGVSSVNSVVPRQTVELNAGQQLEAESERSPAVEPANIQRVTAWMNGQLMFDNESLAQVVARVNRYSTISIEIRDPRVAAMRISGVFNTGDIAGVVGIVTQYLPVRAVYQANGVVVLEDNRKS
jgi:transmembrane sensor